MAGQVGMQALMEAAQRAGVDPGQLQGAMGGGGGGGAPGGMPPGGAPPQSNGGDIAQQLVQLLSPVIHSPKGQMMMQALMAKMGGGAGGGAGGDPRAAMAQQMPPTGGVGTGSPPSQMASPMGEGVDEGPMPSQPVTGRMPLTTEDELEMARKSMGTEAMPSPKDIQLIQSKPTDQNLEMFESRYGPGSANKYMEDGDGSDGEGMSDKD